MYLTLLASFLLPSCMQIDIRTQSTTAIAADRHSSHNTYETVPEIRSSILEAAEQRGLSILLSIDESHGFRVPLHGSLDRN